MQWKNREKGGDKEHHEKANFFIYLSFRMIFFVFKKTYLLPTHLMLFVHAGKRSN